MGSCLHWSDGVKCGAVVKLVKMLSGVGLYDYLSGLGLSRHTKG